MSVTLEQRSNPQPRIKSGQQRQQAEHQAERQVAKRSKPMEADYLPSAENLSPEQILAQLSSSEQIRLIMSHPFFTGRCPHCRQSIQIAKAALGKCICQHCHWSDTEPDEAL